MQVGIPNEEKPATAIFWGRAESSFWHPPLGQRDRKEVFAAAGCNDASWPQQRWFLWRNSRIQGTIMMMPLHATTRSCMQVWSPKCCWLLDIHPRVRRGLQRVLGGANVNVMVFPMLACASSEGWPWPRPRCRSSFWWLKAAWSCI